MKRTYETPMFEVLCFQMQEPLASGEGNPLSEPNPPYIGKDEDGWIDVWV